MFDIGSEQVHEIQKENKTPWRRTTGRLIIDLTTTEKNRYPSSHGNAGRSSQQANRSHSSEYRPECSQGWIF